MDYHALWNEFFKQLFENLPSIINVILTTWIAFNVKTIKNNGNNKNLKKYSDYGGGVCPWSNREIPVYEPKEYEKEIQVNE